MNTRHFILHRDETIPAFDRLMFITNFGGYFSFFSLSFKVCLGLITLMMVLALYIKVKVIYFKEGAKKWDKKYKKWVHLIVFTVILANMSYIFALCFKWNEKYNKYFKGYNFLTYYKDFEHWYHKTLNNFGVIMGAQYFLLSFVFAYVSYSFFKLINEPELKGF